MTKCSNFCNNSASKTNASNNNNNKSNEATIPNNNYTPMIGVQCTVYSVALAVVVYPRDDVSIHSFTVCTSTNQVPPSARTTKSANMKFFYTPMYVFGPMHHEITYTSTCVYIHIDIDIRLENESVTSYHRRRRRCRRHCTATSN